MEITIKKISKISIALIVGIFITLLLLEILLRLIGWYQGNKNLLIKVDNKSKNELRILTLGDSMTALGGDNSYSAQLEKILNDSKLISKKVRVINGGISGNTSDVIVGSITKNIQKYKPDIVVSMVGINDFGNLIYAQNLDTTNKNILDTFKVFQLVKFFKNNIDYSINKKLGLKILPFLAKIAYYVNQKDLSFSLYQKAMVIYQYNDSMPPEFLILANDNRYHWDTESASSLFQIGKIYLIKKDYQKAEFFLRKATESTNYFQHRKIYDLLFRVYTLEGKSDKANDVEKKIIKLTEVAQNNYQKIARVCQSKNIQLVAVQYPLRDLEILKLYLNNFSNVVFVDNNQSFEDAVNKYGFDKVFIDAFAGDFGHGSALGNKITAQNVAKVIIDEVLKSKASDISIK